MSDKKTLSVKRVYAYAVHNSLRKTPPKDFPSTGEIRKTITDIIPAFRVHVEEYQEMIKQAEELSVRLAAKELPEEEAKKAVDAIIDKWRVYNKEHGNEMVDVELSSEAYAMLKMQFERQD